MLHLRLENNSYASWLPLDVHNLIFDFQLERITTYNNDGSVESQTDYLDGIKHGIHRQCSNAFIEEYTYKQGVKDGFYRYWRHGVLSTRATFRNDVLNGPYQDFCDGIMICECSYVNGFRHGLEERWHTNGNKWTECMYINGQKQGLMRVWNENGNQLREMHYNKGLAHGIHKMYNDGTVVCTQTYDHGELVVSCSSTVTLNSPL